MKLKKTFSLLLALLLLAALIGCAPAETTTENAQLQTEETQQPQETEDIRPDTDRSGNPITLPDEVDSIISMAPSATQTLLDLGLKDKIIAVDTYSAMYFDLEELPTFDMMEPDTEQMALLDADLIFTTGMSAVGGADPFKPLRDIGVCIADSPSASSIENMLEDVRFIAACVGAQEACEKQIDAFQKELDLLKSLSAGIENKKRVEVEIACAPDIYTIGNNTFMQEMLTAIGAENIFADQDGYLAVSEEAVVTLNPDVILTMVDYIDDPVGEILGRTGWENVTAVANKAVYLVNTNAVSLPNLHVIDGMKQMAKLIYPDVYSEIEDPFAA